MKTRKLIPLGIISIIFSSLTACSKSEPVSSITVFAAASTTEIVTEIAHLFEEQTGIKVRISTASSGTLARQIEQGAEADIYISASEKWMEYTESLSLLEKSQPFLKNRLVLTSHKDSDKEPFILNADSDFPSLFLSRLSMGDPNHVPAGMYASEALKTLGWYEDLQERFLPGADVRAALSVVELDEVEFGIVYETDALKSTKVKIISIFPEDSYPTILYFCGLLKNSDPRGESFYSFLQNNSEAAELITQYGFGLWD